MFRSRRYRLARCFLWRVNAMHECSIGFLEFLRLNFYLYEYWPNLLTSCSIFYHNVYFSDYLKANSTLPYLGNALICCFFRAIVLWEVEPDHRWRASILRTPKTEFSFATRRKVNFITEAYEIVNPARKLVSLLYVELTVFSDAFHLSLN